MTVACIQKRAVRQQTKQGPWNFQEAGRLVWRVTHIQMLFQQVSNKSEITVEVQVGMQMQKELLQFTRYVSLVDSMISYAALG